MTNLFSCPISRRAILQGGALVLAGSRSLTQSLSALAKDSPEAAQPLLSIGLITDIHYADKKKAGSRYYRQSVEKLDKCVAHFNHIQADFAVELGDFIDLAGSVEEEIRHLKTIDEKFSEFSGERHYVLGNHCVDGLNKKQFFANCGARRPYYSFDQGPFHFIILDACYRSDGVAYGHRNFAWTDANVPSHELEWLRDDLDRTDKRTFVFVHQRLDIAGQHAVNNAAEVREILNQGNNVMTVFQGHNHINEHKLVEGIHYCTLAALVEGSGPESNAFATADVFADGSLRVHGLYRQANHELEIPS